MSDALHDVIHGRATARQERGARRQNPLPVAIPTAQVDRRTIRLRVHRLVCRPLRRLPTQSVRHVPLTHLTADWGDAPQ